MRITQILINNFKTSLIMGEKAPATVEKYIRDVTAFADWLEDCEADKDIMLKYKEHLKAEYAPASVNAAISSLNSFFAYCGRHELKLKTIKVPKKLFSGSDRELKLDEYKRLLKAAKDTGNMRMYYIIKTIFVTGIRVSELKYITAEAVESGTAVIDNKGRLREVFLTGELCSMLRKYIKKLKIKSGAIFVTKNNRPVDRSNISKAMKRLAKLAGVALGKVFPHNLRHLFARQHYSAYKDIVRLADVLGHSNVNTTRIYTAESGSIHRRQLEKLRLARC